MREEVAAILTVGGRYALQLRDAIPTIPFPGHWGLFGGEALANEHPAAAVRREIHEELSLDIIGWTPLWVIRGYSPFWADAVRCHVFAADVTALWPTHELREGRATGLFTFGDLPEPIPLLFAALLERYHAGACGDERRDS
jgi:8-oxo-dGTP diphosphatase